MPTAGERATKSTTFWCPAELREWLDALGAQSTSAALVTQLDLAQALRETLGGELWMEVRALAVRQEGTEGQALGKALAQLVREALGRLGRAGKGKR